MTRETGKTTRSSGLTLTLLHGYIQEMRPVSAPGYEGKRYVDDQRVTRAAQ